MVVSINMHVIAGNDELLEILQVVQLKTFLLFVNKIKARTFISDFQMTNVFYFLCT